MVRLNVLSTLRAEDYLQAAIETANYIDTKRIDSEHGLVWSMDDAVVSKDEEYYDEICLYAGSAGIAHFYLSLWHYTKDDKYLQDAVDAARYIRYRWDNQRTLRKNFSQWAYSTGYSGIASFLLELYEITKDPQYAAFVEEIVAEILKDARVPANGVGYTWGTFPGIVGDAGIVLFLLEAAAHLGHDDWRQFAIRAGESFLTQARPYEGGGIYYLGVNPEYFHSDSNYIDPNFPMGAAGIGFTLLRLYEESGDERFLCAVDGIEEFHEAVGLKGEDSILLPHGLPTRPDTYYLGYCHGPAGTARFYRKYYEVTGEERYLDWEQRLLNGILGTGAPEVHSPGYWNTHCYCCGTAGFTDLFIGLWAETGEDRYLSYAKRAARQIIGTSTQTEENGIPQRRWYQAFVGADPSRITTNIGMYDGAAGIAWALLQTYGALTDQFYVHRTVDDPYPEQAV